MNWFALRVSPMKEFAVETILRNHDLKAFCPVETKWKRIGPKKKRTPFNYAMLPRYVFAACGDPWEDILRQRWARNVQGVVSIDGIPARIPEAALSRLARLSGSIIPTQTVAVHKSFAVGDVVRVSRGPLQGRLVPLERINGKAGEVLTEMFGSPGQVVRISLDDLEAA